MIETKWIEMINRQLDGELDEKEEAQLMAYLEQNKEAQQFYYEQQHMISYLETVPEVEPPADLKESIMAGITDSGQNGRRNSGAHVFDLRSVLNQERVRVIISHAAFLMIGFGVAAYLIHTSSQKPAIDLNQLSGTIGLNHQNSNQSGLTETIELQQLKGHVDLKENKKEVWITFNFARGKEFRTNLIYDPQLLNFQVFMPSGSEDILLENSDTGLVVQGKGSFLLLFTKLKNQRSELQIELTGTSREIERFVLTVNEQ